MPSGATSWQSHLTCHCQASLVRLALGLVCVGLCRTLKQCWVAQKQVGPGAWIHLAARVLPPPLSPLPSVQSFRRPCPRRRSTGSGCWRWMARRAARHPGWAPGAAWGASMERPWCAGVCKQSLHGSHMAGNGDSLGHDSSGCLPLCCLQGVSPEPPDLGPTLLAAAQQIVASVAAGGEHEAGSSAAGLRQVCSCLAANCGCGCAQHWILGQEERGQGQLAPPHMLIVHPFHAPLALGYRLAWLHLPCMWPPHEGLGG